MNVLRLKEIILMNKDEFIEKTVISLVRPETYSVMRYMHNCLQEGTQLN